MLEYRYLGGYIMCIFCKIINNEIPSYKVYEDENFLAFLDISQATLGHTLVVPKKHYENIFELPEDSSIFNIVTKLATKIKKATNCSGINILNNNGVSAGQTVNHFHIHIIPRYENDKLEINFPSNSLTKEEFNDLLLKINNA